MKFLSLIPTRLLLCVFVVSYSLMIPIPPAFCEKDQGITIKQFKIRQEILSNKGVWISRPSNLDQNILKLIELYKIRSLEDYSRWLEVHIKYERDTPPKDAWASPLETLNKKYGDCEDFTFLTYEVMRIIGYKPQFLALVTTGRAHAICTFKDDDYYVWFDNARLMKTKANTFEDFAKIISKEYNAHSLLELNVLTHQWKTIYKTAFSS